MSQFDIGHSTTSIIPCHFFQHCDSNQPHLNAQSFDPNIFFILVIPPLESSFHLHIAYESTSDYIQSQLLAPPSG